MFLLGISKLLTDQTSLILKLLILERLAIFGIIFMTGLIGLKILRTDFLLLFLTILLLEAVIGLALTISLSHNLSPIKINKLAWWCSLNKTQIL